MAHTDNWNATFEALPTDDNYGYEIDNYLRIVWRAVRERMEVDHHWKATASTTDDGKHKKVTLPVLAVDPSAVASSCIIYAKDVGTKAEIFIIDEDGNVIQITSAGVSSSAIPAGTKMLFYADTAPTGWTIQNTLDDKVVFVTKGSVAGGQTGGEAHVTGTWTQPNHTHSHDHLVAGTCSVPDATYGATGLAGQHGVEASGTIAAQTFSVTSGNNATEGATVNTWRPAAYNFIVCSKN